MKKIMLNQYGSPDVMEMVDLPKPRAGQGQVVIKTVAIGVNDPDIGIRANGPFPTMPKEMKPVLPHSLGQDFSGIVVEVGEGVTNVSVGDHVIGMAFMQAYSEYILADALSLAKVPQGMNLVALGGFTLSVATAYAATIRDGQASKGQKVLIHGGAGGVGSMAIQLAKHAGAYVIATGSTHQLDYMKSLGADEVIDYKQQNFTELVSDLDLVVNLTGLKTLEKSYQVIKGGGRVTSVNAPINPAQTKLRGITGIYSRGFMGTKELQEAVDLYAQGKLQVHVDKTYPFDLESIKQAQSDFVTESNIGRKLIVFEDEAK